MNGHDQPGRDRQDDEHSGAGQLGHGQRGQVGHEQPGHEQGGNSHRWLMVACCIPMVVLVGVLLATGVAGSGAILFAVICLGVMALMMFAMPGSHNH